MVNRSGEYQVVHSMRRKGFFLPGLNDADGNPDDVFWCLGVFASD